MREQRFITPEEERAARAVRPRVQPYRSPRDTRAGWAKDYLRQQFRNQFGGDHPPDWQVQTGFLPSLQDAAEKAVADGIRRLNSPGLEAALVALDPQTGDVLAMVGGSNYARSTFNRATRGRRQPGSAFKPLVYTAALAHGFSPVSILNDLDRVSAPDDPEWRPRNVDACRDRGSAVPDPARGAGRLEQRRRRGAAATGRQPRGPAPRRRRRPARSAGCAVAGARHRTGVAAGSDRRVFDVSRRGRGRPAARHHHGLRRRRRPGRSIARSSAPASRASRWRFK